MTGAELKKHRKRLGLNQTELGKILGVHLVSVSRWETNVNPVPVVVARLVPLLKRQRRTKKGAAK